MSPSWHQTREIAANWSELLYAINPLSALGCVRHSRRYAEREFNCPEARDLLSISALCAIQMTQIDDLRHSPDVTDLLLAWSGGDASAGEQLLNVVYAELHHQADRAMRLERAGDTLQVTGLVHEAYIRLVDQRRVQWKNRAHFFGISAQTMRRILVDHARARIADKRGGKNQVLTLDDDIAPAAEDSVEIVALHEALERLSVMDSEQARIVELRYFGGLTIEETAETMRMSQTAVKAEWAIARAWLRRELENA